MASIIEKKCCAIYSYSSNEFQIVLKKVKLKKELESWFSESFTLLVRLNQLFRETEKKAICMLLRKRRTSLTSDINCETYSNS